MFSIHQPGGIKINFCSSLQGKLCLAITSAVAILIIGYALLAYNELKSDLFNTAQETLEAQVLPPVHHSKIEQAANKQELQQRAFLLTSTLSLHGVNCVVYDSQGRLLSTFSDNKPAWKPQYRVQQNSFQIENGQINQPLQLVYIIPLKNPEDYNSGYIVAWSSLGHVIKSLQTEGIFLLAGGLLVLFLTFFLIYILTAVILNPLNNLVNTSRAVAANDLTARAPVTNTHDELAYLTAVFNQMLEGLQDSFDAREQALNLVRKNVADISHELRSPLTSINGYIDVLRRGAVTEPIEQERVYSSIKREISRLSRLLDNLLTLARLDSRLSCEKYPVDIADLIKESARRAELLDPERKIKVEIEKDCIIQGEGERLQQMMNNLVDNALYHSGREAAITLGCKRDGNQIRIWVKDNGKGINEQELPFVFERFWRSPSSSSTRGSGLGLSIVKAVVENHGGQIEVQSTLNKGTNFIITIPAHNYNF